MEQFTVDQVCLSRGEPEIHAIDRLQNLRNRFVREEVAMSQNGRTTRTVERLIAEFLHELIRVRMMVDNGQGCRDRSEAKHVLKREGHVQEHVLLCDRLGPATTVRGADEGVADLVVLIEATSRVSSEQTVVTVTVGNNVNGGHGVIWIIMI